ncbi:PREDICTED: DEP domain-containing mTOR-interacting protein [Bison bison bison]|uniref:DEP domain-containing mTOR-interacting protein n=1 Tax=Bison bison bison TaxID=43346 RepID=A0A6P3HPF2_BISBB|nr:PREDICTED: DEP domain-containing mTOR-interacting protein [Bison bison bison]
MQKLADRGIIHHVCDEHKEFKDVKLFYRFRKDDGTFPLDNEVKAFVRGQRLYEKLMSPENTLLQPREEEGVKYERTFMASEFLDWLVQEGEATAREEAEQLCQRLLEHGIIQHVSNKHPFVDSNLLYQFRMNFRRRRRLMELLSEKSPSSQETHDSPFCLRKQGHDNRKSASFTSVSPSKEIKTASAARRSSMGSCGSGGYFSSSPTLSNSPPVLCNPKSVLKRPVTSEELLTPGAPYARKTFTIVGDAVGWGFVVRGSKPCHIQAVDPSGPAAAAGMKVCQLVVSVNALGREQGFEVMQDANSLLLIWAVSGGLVSVLQQRKPAHQGPRLLTVLGGVTHQASFKGLLKALWAWVFTADTRRRRASGNGILSPAAAPSLPT